MERQMINTVAVIRKYFMDLSPKLCPTIGKIFNELGDEIVIHLRNRLCHPGNGIECLEPRM